MGRYYNGDIEGKFWFGVQSSDDADFFGVEGTKPEMLEYYFDEDNVKTVDDGVKKCLKELGDYKIKIDEFFEKNDSYNNEMLQRELEIGESKVKMLLEWYARLDLGQKIQKHLKENGNCTFTAEC